MNVIISNKYQSMLQGLGIETLKTLNGEFTVDEIISEFKVIFFQRMILDITAIKNYKNIENLQKLAISLDADKIILLLNDDEESGSTSFQSKLISMGIYNFTQTLEGIRYLYDHPNNYRDVAHIQQLDMGVNKPEVKTEVKTVVEKEYQTETVYVEKNGPKVIGIKNITMQTGATTLTYMMLKQLEKNYKACAVELEKHDFNYFNSKNLFSKKVDELGNFIVEHKDFDVILVDLNNANAESLCNEVIYLIEPSIIKLNKYMLLNPKGLTPYKGKKIVVNQSLLNQKDILDFEYESRLKVFFNMPPLDEREANIYILNVFLVKLGFTLQEDIETEKKKKGLFR